MSWSTPTKHDGRAVLFALAELLDRGLQVMSCPMKGKSFGDITAKHLFLFVEFCYNV